MLCSIASEEVRKVAPSVELVQKRKRGVKSLDTTPMTAWEERGGREGGSGRRRQARGQSSCSGTAVLVSSGGGDGGADDA